jgi:hypothetical protein
VLWHPDVNRRRHYQFQMPHGQTAAVYKKLDEQFALRYAPTTRRDWIRVSAHWMTTHGDHDALGKLSRSLLLHE